MSHTKIMVIKRKELFLTILLSVIVLLLLTFLFFLFAPKKEETSDAGHMYRPGTYSSTFTLGENELSLSIRVTENAVTSIEITNLSEAVTTMYPLVEPSLQNISGQLQNGIEISEITISENSRYTELLLLNAIDAALAPARTASAP